MGVFKWIGGIVIIAALALAAFFFLGAGIEDTHVERFTLTGLADIDTEGFTLQGDLYLENPSDLSVPVTDTEYDVILNRTGDVIGSGTLTDFTLEADDITQVPFEQHINWQPSAQMAMDLATQEEVIIIVRGELYVDAPGADRFAIPFEASHDIKRFLTEYVNSQVQIVPNGFDPEQAQGELERFLQ